MNFHVKTDALRATKGTLTSLAGDTAVADAYKTTYLNLGAGDGALFVHVDNVAKDVAAKLDTLFDRLKSVLTDSGLELSAVAKFYDETDSGTEARLDGKLALIPLKPGEAYDASVPFEDTVPEDPGDYEPPPDHDAPEPDDGEIILAPGPFGEPGGTDSSGGYA